ncbi:CBS domain-containing protein [Sphingomonas sp. H39-1-10]|uniref:CBS domain-containing protein n=1 Tax=Sphingomonas TaxID=13687 RepID=UPI00088DC46D|nr:MULTISPECIES: CBS domain-containing protein [Sphingomonas]MDF0490615.1 CBS domain-containing protein [Sphingomonas pollutisoli]SDA36761.1 CBS domain-containing protein [Sphingomonas sp. NFR15]
MTIEAILQTKSADVTAVPRTTTVAEAARLLAEKRIGAVPVLDGDAVAGIFSERDVIHALAAQGAAALDNPVGDVMTAPAITVSRDEAVLGALSLMTRRRIRHLPVVEGGRMIGFISIGDLVKYRIDRIEADAEAMRSYIQSA